MKHISHYFAFIENLLGEGSSSIEVMQKILKENGCPEEQIDPVINGHLCQLIQDNIPRKGALHSSDIHKMLHGGITDINDIHIDKLLNYMKKNGLININNDNCSILMVIPPNNPINID